MFKTVAAPLGASDTVQDSKEVTQRLDIIFKASVKQAKTL
jgi:hypothetical protein